MAKKKKRQAQHNKKEQVQIPQIEHVKFDEFTTERNEPDWYPMNITVGDMVIMTKKYPVSNDIVGLIWKVIEGPKYMDGNRRVRLEGYPKWYPVDGLKIVG